MKYILISGNTIRGIKYILRQHLDLSQWNSQNETDDENESQNDAVAKNYASYK